MTTALTAAGFPYPNPDEPVANMDLSIKQLAEQCDARTVQKLSGTALLSMAAVASGGTATATINFATPFLTAPDAFAQVAGFVSGSGFAVVRAVDSVTTTQLRIVLANFSTAAATFTDLPVRWTAFGRKA